MRLRANLTSLYVTTLRLCAPRECCEVSMLVMDCSPQTEDDFISSTAMNNNNHAVKEAHNSWHPHVYANPPKQPTPHTISDILGWSAPPPGDEPLNLTVRSRSPHRPFREPSTNGVDKGVNGRLDLTARVVKRAPTSHVNKGRRNRCSTK